MDRKSEWIFTLPTKGDQNGRREKRNISYKIGYTINISNKSQTAAASKIQAVPFLLDCNLPFLS